MTNLNLKFSCLDSGSASIKLAGRNVTDVVDEHPMTLSRKLGVKSLKALPHADSSVSQITVERGTSFIPVSIEDAVAYWTIMAQEGN